MKSVVVDQEFISRMNVFRQPIKGVGLIEACSRSVTLFAEHMLGVKLYSWQIYFLNKLEAVCNEKDLAKKHSLRKEFAVITSRQIGKSTAVAIFALWCAVFNKYPGTTMYNSIVGIVSASDDQAKKLLGEVRKYIIAGDKFMELSYLNPDGSSMFPPVKQYNGTVLGFFSLLLDEKAQQSVSVITFKAYDPKKHGDFLLRGSKVGSVIQSKPPTQVVLGQTYTVIIIDEAGRTERISDEFFKEVITPTGMNTDAIRIYLSTPWVASGFFYRAIDPDNFHGGSSADVSSFTIEAIQIENPLQYSTVMKEVEKMRKDGDLDEVRRAFYCEFVKSGKSYFDPQAVAQIFTSEYEMYSKFDLPCDVGVDFGGQTVSSTVVTISALAADGSVYRVHHWKYPVGKDDSLLSDIEVAFQNFNIQRIIPDDCPAGWHYIRKMKEKGWNVVPMNFKAEKVKKYGALRAMVNRGRVKSYRDDELRIEMVGLQVSQGKQTTAIEHAPGESDDMIDSFLMSAYFYVEEDNKFEFFDVDDVDDGSDPYV